MRTQTAYSYHLLSVGVMVALCVCFFFLFFCQAQSLKPWNRKDPRGHLLIGCKWFVGLLSDCRLSFSHSSLDIHHTSIIGDHWIARDLDRRPQLAGTDEWTSDHGPVSLLYSGILCTISYDAGVGDHDLPSWWLRSPICN